MRSLKHYVLCLLLLLSATLIHANSLPQWQIIPAESELTFTAIQNDAPVAGAFKTFTGEIFVDPANYQTSTIHIVIDMNSVSASYADLTGMLISADWFNSKMFPKAEFKATKFNKTGNNTYEAEGTLTIRDKTVPVTLTFTAEESPKGHALVDGYATIKRTDFGVGQGDWASTKEIKDEVKVHFKVAAALKR